MLFGTFFLYPSSVSLSGVCEEIKRKNSSVNNLDLDTEKTITEFGFRYDKSALRKGQILTTVVILFQTWLG